MRLRVVGVERSTERSDRPFALRISLDLLGVVVQPCSETEMYRVAAWLLLEHPSNADRRPQIVATTDDFMVALNEVLSTTECMVYVTFT